MNENRQTGLTMLELAFVLVVMGVLASTLIPAIHAMHEKSMQEDDRKLVLVLKEALVGQFLATGALPACKDAAGNPSAGNCDAQKSLGALPVRFVDMRNSSVKYDVWNVSGSDLTATNRTNACATLDTAIAAAYASGQPAICQGVPDYGNPTAAYCTAPQNIAFVIVATGRNRPGQSGELPNATWLGGQCPGNRNIGTDRVFERPDRRQNAPCYYDDIVEVVTLQELKAKCPL